MKLGGGMILCCSLGESWGSPGEGDVKAAAKRKNASVVGKRGASLCPANAAKNRIAAATRQLRKPPVKEKEGSQGRGRMRFAEERARRRAAPSWMPLMRGRGMEEARRGRRLVARRRRRASETRAPDAVTISRGSGWEREVDAMAWMK